MKLSEYCAIIAVINYSASVSNMCSRDCWIYCITPQTEYQSKTHL